MPFVPTVMTHLAARDNPGAVHKWTVVRTSVWGMESRIFVAYSNKITKNNWSNVIWFLMRLGGQLVYHHWFITSSWVVRHTSARMTQYKWRILSGNGNPQQWRICVSLKVTLRPSEIRVDVEGLVNTEEFNGVYMRHWIVYYVVLKTIFRTQTNSQSNQPTK